MNRALMAAVIATLAVPVLALAALIVQQEMHLSGAEVLNVPVRGVDPRDLLRGHYIVGDFDWDWRTEPTSEGPGGLCVLSTAARTPRVAFIEGWRAGDRADDCRMVLAGTARPKRGSRPAGFIPAALDSGSGQLQLFVSEIRAPDLENAIRRKPGSLTVDLAVRPDGFAAIRALRVDNEVIGR
jgi:hypothetical protein